MKVLKVKATDVHKADVVHDGTGNSKVVSVVPYRLPNGQVSLGDGRIVSPDTECTVTRL